MKIGKSIYTLNDILFDLDAGRVLVLLGSNVEALRCLLSDRLAVDDDLVAG